MPPTTPQPLGPPDKSGSTPYSDGTWHDAYDHVWSPQTGKWTNSQGAEWDPQTRTFGPPPTPTRETLQDFQNRLDAFKTSTEYDTLNLNRARQELDRWLQGQQVAGEDAKNIAFAKEQIGKYGTPPGKSSFSANELGAPFAQYARFAGLDPNATMAQYSGTQTWNPVADRMASLAGMGIENAPPIVPGLFTDPANIPGPPPPNPAPAAGLPYVPSQPQAGSTPVPPRRPAPPPDEYGLPFSQDSLPQYARGTLPPQAVQRAMQAIRLRAKQPNSPSLIPRYAIGTGAPDALGTTATGTQIPLDWAQIIEMLSRIPLQARGQDITLAGAQLQAQNDRVAARQRALETMASASGPGDWVKYNYLLNGMAAPTGQRVDPTSWANEIRDPYVGSYADYANGQGGGYGGTTQRWTPPPGASTDLARPLINNAHTNPQWNPGAYADWIRRGTGAGPRATSTFSDAAPTGPGRFGETQDSLGHIWRNSRWEDPAGHYLQGSTWMNPDATAYQAAPTAPAATIPAANPGASAAAADWMASASTPGAHSAAGAPTLAAGGYTRAPQFIAGDQPGRLGNAAELIVNPLHAPIQVLSHPQLMALFHAAKAHVAPRFVTGTGAAFPGQGGPGWGTVSGDTFSNGVWGNPVRQGQGTDLADDGSYGMPQTPSYRTYAPGVVANQPFYQKLIGNQPSREFGAFGAPLSNASLGIYDAPANINLQNYEQLSPSEQQQVQSLYSQGLGVDWNDIYARAKAAFAPMLAGAPQRWMTPSYGG